MLRQLISGLTEPAGTSYCRDTSGIMKRGDYWTGGNGVGGFWINEGDIGM